MDLSEIWHAISLYAVVDARIFEKLLCLLFQKLFKHFRLKIQLQTDIQPNTTFYYFIVIFAMHKSNSD